MKQIPLTQGKVALVDDDDFEVLSGYKWYCGNEGYAMRTAGTLKRGQRTIRMARFITDAPSDKQVDHIDGDRLNNQKCNLRLCSNLENCRNQRKPRIVTSSVFKGVHRHSGNKCWQAAIRHGGKQIYLGVFTDEEQAARAYDEAAKKYHGEFALLNF